MLDRYSKRRQAVPLILAVLIACGPGASSPPSRLPAPPASEAAAPASAPADPLADELNLSFEKGEPPEKWASGIMGEGVLQAGQGYDYQPDLQVVHGGARSLRIAGEGNFASASTVLPIERARGKHVRLSGWIKTQDVSKWAGLWLRIDGPWGPGSLGFDNMAGRGPKGTTEWTRYELEFDVPAEATAVVFGALLVGGGTAWVDELHVDLGDVVPAKEIEVHGRVSDAAGRSVADAVVATNRPGAPQPGAVVRTGADGRFVVTLREGLWAFTATSDSGVAAYREPARVTADVEVGLVLGDQGFTVSGRVSTASALPADAVVVATRYSDVEGDLFVTAPDADGRYRLRLPSAKGYSIAVVATAILGSPVKLSRMADQTADLLVSVLAPPPSAVVDWVKKTAMPLTTVEAGHGFDDLAPLAALIGDARIVALGEATHGTREFFQMKHRMLEYLVEKRGFRLFAIEANLTEARRVNDYVLHGKGTAAEALAGMYFWVWDTEEVLAMIEWMRAYNLDARHKTKVQFLGFDMQTTKVAWANVRAYLEKIDPEHARSLPAGLALFGDDDRRSSWAKMTPAERAALRATLDALVARLDTQRKAYTRASSKDEWRWAREDARLVAQAAIMDEADAAGSGGGDARDAAMAENVGWILDQEGKSSKVVLWAHNAHVAQQVPWFTSMGSHLRAKYGAKYRVLGFVFAEGGFQAHGTAGAPRGTGVQPFTVGTPPDTHASAAFTLAGQELCVLDLRKAPPGPIADWFRAVHLVRDIGAVFQGEQSMASPHSLAQLYDAVIFVRKTTAARPNPTGKREK